VERFEAVVVGGGPAGSTCAWKLRRAGLDVVVLDRARFPRDKVCAGWLTPPVVAELELDTTAYRDGGRVFQPITGFRTSRMGAPEIETRYPEPVSYGIRRCELDHYLLQRAGVPVRAEAVADLRRQGEGWLVNERIQTPLLVGAAGHFCPVARHLGARRAGPEVVAAQEIEFVMDPRQQRECRIDPEVPELFFTRDLRGYGWCFRKQDCLNVGFGRLDDRRFGAHVEEFASFLARERRVPGDTPRRFKGHAYSVYPLTARPLLDDGVLLVGDAAGLAYGESGEGIRPAVESGLLAARTILAAQGRYTRESLSPYREAIESRFGPRRQEEPPPHRRSFTAIAGAAVLRSRWLTRRLVIERWFLHAHAPAVVWSEPPLASSSSERPSASAVTAR
jgi:menaquinone-9 beta-reductase